MPNRIVGNVVIIDSSTTNRPLIGGLELGDSIVKCIGFTAANISGNMTISFENSTANTLIRLTATGNATPSGIGVTKFFDLGEGLAIKNISLRAFVQQSTAFLYLR